MNNKRALVCGSSKGIGAETAIELSKSGVSIILFARNELNFLFLERVMTLCGLWNGENEGRYEYILLPTIGK